MSEREPLRQRLRTGLTALKLELEESIVEQLLDYVDLLVRWNAAYNLTAVRDAGEMVTRHLLDSLAVLPYVSGHSLADLGSGAGFPGIPLALARPGLEVHLVDSNGKKARFLREAVRHLEADARARRRMPGRGDVRAIRLHHGTGIRDTGGHAGLGGRSARPRWTLAGAEGTIPAG